MNISELEILASKGARLDDDFRDPTRGDIMAAIEVIDKARELLSEIQLGRWDKETISSKTATIIWFTAKIAGMYGVSLEGAVKSKAEEKAREMAAPDKPSVRFPVKKGIGKWNKARHVPSSTSGRSTKTTARSTRT